VKNDDKRKPLELDPGFGMLFQNPTANEENRRPQYRGELLIPEGVTGRVEVSLWRRTSKSGKPYLSFAVQVPGAGRREKPGAPQSGGRPSGNHVDRRSPPPADDFDDDIPF
jgi:hypothetical protein